MAKLEDILKRIGVKIAFHRKAKGLNQSDLARELNKDRQIIQRLEKGKVNPTIKTLHEISIALDIEVTDLLQK